MAVSAADVVLSAEGLAKRYGEREVVSDVSFALHRGEVFGFLGPNGAGKTTTIRMLVGLVRPTRGRVVIDGHDLGQGVRGRDAPRGLHRGDPRPLQVPDGSREPRALRAHAGRRGRGADRHPRGARAHGRPTRRSRPHVLARDAPARRHRAGSSVRPGRSHPRRADERPRSRGHSRDARARAAARGRARARGLRVEPPAFRGREDGGPHRDRPPRTHARGGDARRPDGRRRVGSRTSSSS